VGVDALEELRVVDFGDAPVLPADAVAPRRRSRRPSPRSFPLAPFP
jgi:hypothetical protein